MLAGLFPTSSFKDKLSSVKEKANELLTNMKMYEHKSKVAGALPLGIQKKIGIAIALAAKPKLLLLDEPVSGLNSAEKEDVMNLIVRVAKENCTCIIIEHHVKTIVNCCDRIAVLNFGRLIMEGTPKMVINNRQVISAYLGE